MLVHDGMGFSIPGAGLVKKAARGVARGAKTVGKGAARGVSVSARTVARGAKGAARGVKAAGKQFSPPWEGVGFDKGWATRLGRRLANVGLTPDAILCNMKKYRNSKFCKIRGVIAWEVGKRGLELAFGMKPGTIDDIEGELNRVGKDPKKREAKAREIAKKRKIPLDALMPLVIKEADPTWWQKFIRALGLE